LRRHGGPFEEFAISVPLWGTIGVNRTEESDQLIAAVDLPPQSIG
jgi:hypothetical protein